MRSLADPFQIVLLVGEQLLLFHFYKIGQVFRICVLELLVGEVYLECYFCFKTISIAVT